MFVLGSNITIDSPVNGVIAFKGATEIRAKRSVGSLIDTCSITLPTSARLRNTELVTEYPESGKLFSRGDKVTMQLGYNGQLLKEFEGFIKSISFATPLLVECEGYAYLLRKKNIKKSWKSVELKELCAYLVEGTGITLSNNIPGLPIENYVVNNATALKVLEDIVSKYKLTAYFRFNELYVGLEEAQISGTVKYGLGYNTADVNNLKYQTAEDVRMKIVAKTTQQDGERKLYEIGDPDGEVREIIVKPVAMDRIKAIAEDYLKKFKYTGYRGSLTGFLQPYAEPGYSAQIISKRYPERSGTFFVHATEVTYGMGGARRIVELSKRLSS